jgi:N-acetylneuraminate synthase
MKQITIGQRVISKDESPYIVAELSGNHNGSIDRAKQLIYNAKICGADAIKIQTFKPDSITLPCFRNEFMIKDGPWKGRNLYELYKETCLPYEWHAELFDYAEKTGITLFSSPFAEADVKFLETFNVPAYKIASNELTHLPLIKKVILTKKPIIISTGTATLEEIQKTINFFKDHNCSNYMLLYCVSSYPAPLEELNLLTLKYLQEEFNCLVGLSDHSIGITAPIVATALGACLIEKHFTLNRNDGGSDSSFSIEPSELKKLCENIKSAYQSLGSPSFGFKDCEKKSPIFKRHYYAIKDIAQGEALSERNVSAVRSPGGIGSYDYEKVIGRRAACDIKKHNPIKFEDICL